MITAPNMNHLMDIKIIKWLVASVSLRSSYWYLKMCFSGTPDKPTK